MMRSHRAVIELVIITVSLTVVSASPPQGARVAAKHLVASKALADAKVNLETDHSVLIAAIWNDGCHLSRELRRSQEPDALRFADLYIKDICRPWADFWFDALKPCGSCNSPAWCDFGTQIASRLDL